MNSSPKGLCGLLQGEPINLGVIAAGVLVLWLGSSLPDLIIGAVVFVIVSLGAVRILRLAR